MAAQIANGVVSSSVATTGSKAAAATLGGVEREAAAAKAGGTKALAAKMAPAAPVKAALPGAGGKAVVGVGKSGVGVKLASGTVFTGKGAGIGLGLGLGPWGPIILGVVGAAALYAYFKSRQVESLQNEEEAGLQEALAQ